ncbi:PB1 domain-containing protein [Ditylenchus destructor]|nr:PB1 domain-containing protein [Ditylenchus destructor]
MSVIHIKSKFDSEFRRFAIPLKAENAMSYAEFRSFVESVHSLHNIPFTLCYTSVAGDLLPITNDENFRKAFESAQPCLRLLIQRKGESWEEKYGYGTDTFERKRKGLSLFNSGSNKSQRRNYNISNPEDFRQVSAIIDVGIVPDTHRRVRLCKHGSDRPLGFYIRTGSAVRLTTQGAVKVDGIFISRLVEGGLAESTGLLGINDEVIEVNGIDVQGKSIDQVTDMMVANAHNLIVTTKPANQRNTLHNRMAARQQFQRTSGGQGSSAFNNGNNTFEAHGYSNPDKYQKGEDHSFDSEEDEVVDYLNSPPPYQHHH